jgi:hypothetical protein
MKVDFYFPTGGNEGSILDLCRRYLYSDKPEDVAWEVCRKPQVAINVISTLKQYGGDKIALHFAEEVIRQTAFAYSR